jgi:hypothetical protein
MTTHQAAHVAVLEAIRDAYAAMVCPTAFDKVRALDAAIELMKQAGDWAFVPLKLTDAMVRAFADAPAHYDEGAELQLAWEAMIAAAPTETSR